MKRIHECTFPVVALAFIFLCLNGCNSKQATQTSLPAGLNVEEYPLQDAPTLDPLSFVPVQGTQEEILAKHQQERSMSFQDNHILFNNQPAISAQLGNENLVASESYTDTVTSQGTFQKVTVQVYQDGMVIFSIPAGDVSPIYNLQGLWTYSNHWVLEIARVTLDVSSNDVPLEPVGQIIQDGELLNERFGYDHAFGFQLMNEKPFFFFERQERIGVSYDGQEVLLGYTQVSHYQCCSGTELNPRVAQNMVAFFAQRDGQWYYVEIGIFK
jgi:hypothetical protein